MAASVSHAFLTHRSTAAFASRYCCIQSMYTVHVLLGLPLSTSRASDHYIFVHAFIYLFFKSTFSDVW